MIREMQRYRNKLNMTERNNYCSLMSAMVPYGFTVALLGGAVITNCSTATLSQVVICMASTGTYQVPGKLIRHLAGSSARKQIPRHLLPTGPGQ